jgi:hypothetical protein
MRKAIQDASDKSAGLASAAYLFGINVIQEDDPSTRKCMAVAMSATSGQPACYEDQDGNLIVVEMPASESSFARFLKPNLTQPSPAKDSSQ